MTSAISRRRFIGSAVASGALTIVPRHVLGGAPTRRPERQDHAGPHRHGHAGIPRDRRSAGRSADPDRRRLRPQHGQQRLRGVGQERHPQPDPNLPGEACLERGRQRLSRRPRGGPGSGGRLLREAAGRGELQGLLCLRRLPRAVGERKGPGRRQDHDARSSPRHDRDRGDEEGQARPDAQAPRQPDVRRHGWSSRRPARRRWPRTCWPMAAEPATG